MKTLIVQDVEEIAEMKPPKNVVEKGDMFIDLANDVAVRADHLSDSSGWRYLTEITLSEDDPTGIATRPAGTVPDSDLLDPSLFRHLTPCP